MALQEIFKRKGFKLPDGWMYILAGFIITNVFVVCNYNLTKKAQEEPNLLLYYDKIRATGSVLQPNLCAIPLSKQSFDYKRFNYKIEEINTIKIINDSNIEAKKVRLKMKIRDNNPFIFSIITVDEKYSCEEWCVFRKDQDNKFVELEIDFVKGKQGHCNVYFVYAYSRSISKREKNVEEKALLVSITWEGQRRTSPQRDFDLEY